MKPARPRGRPVEADAEATRRQVIKAARLAFAEYGYMATTYRVLQERTGLTAATLYHYFPSKLDLYATVHQDVHRAVYDEWFKPAISGVTTFVDKLEAFLAAANRMNVSDASLPAFVIGSRMDVRRHSELAPLAASAKKGRDSFFNALIDAGIAAGELDAADRRIVADLLDVLSAGLVATSDDPARHARAVDGIRRLVRHDLVRLRRPRGTT